jgi:hypothetical protein
VLDTSLPEAVEHVLDERDPSAVDVDPEELPLRGAVERDPAGHVVTADEQQVNRVVQVGDLACFLAT